MLSHWGPVISTSRYLILVLDLVNPISPVGGSPVPPDLSFKERCMFA